jgi:putative hydrolase of the HAD superfamily
VIDAVLFDWGHTLVRADWDEDRGLEGNRVGLAAVGRQGLPEPGTIDRYFAERLAELFPADAEDEVDLIAINRACFEHLGCPLADDELEHYVGVSQRFWTEGYDLHPRIPHLVDELRREGVRIGVVSNLATPLRHFVLPLAVDSIILSSEVGKRKPHPAIFRRALDDLSVDPAGAVFVGDRLRQDVGGAAAVGMRTVQAAWFYRDDGADDVQPDLVAEDPADILDWLRSIAPETTTP